MPKARYRLADVFGIVRDLPANYIERTDVDGELVDTLTRDKHIVIYGSSKQGKTCLRKHCLRDDDYITVTCSNRMDVGELNSAILKATGYTIELTTTKTVTGKNKVSARFGGELSVPLVGKVTGEVGSAKGESETIAATSADLELDVYDVNDIISALTRIKFNKFIVLEDFHYLLIETQKDFSVALKAFHESSPFCFIIVGVWLDENRLIQFNGDLTGRVNAVNADEWSKEELLAVIKEGGRLLNVNFDSSFLNDLVNGAYESVSIVQESCFEICKEAKIIGTLDEPISVGLGVDAQKIIKEVVDTQSGRYRAFINNFAAGFQETRLEMYKWLLYPVLTSSPSNLETGLRLTQITKTIAAKHPEGEGLNPGNVTQALQSVASLQVKRGTKPIILDYDQTNTRLNVVDRGFLIWLGYQDRAELLASVGLPVDAEPPD